MVEYINTELIPIIADLFTDEQDKIHRKYFMEALSLIPTTDVTRVKWISVKERLPEEKNEKYWICTDTGYQCECRWTNVNPFWSHLETDWHWNIVDIPQYSEVVAWMPLPEPYKEIE